jgi:hypothetical protein
VNCLTVRVRLAEHALGVLPDGDASSVDRHLEWCAACRKEAGELQRAAATLAYSVAPAELPAELEELVVRSVREAAGRRRTAMPRRSRVVAAAGLAAMLALSGLGWGAVMAGRNERLREQMAAARAAEETSIGRFKEVLQELEGTDSRNVVAQATLASPKGRPAGGSALVLLSPSSDDMALVVVTGLDELQAGQLPLTVRLVGERVASVVVGEIRALDSGGQGGVYRVFVDSLSGFDEVMILDARGRVLLDGALGTRAPTESPGPVA